MENYEEDEDLLGGELTEGLITLLDTPEKVNQTKRFMDMLVGYRELMMMYTCAVKKSGQNLKCLIQSSAYVTSAIQSVRFPQG